MYVSSTGDGWNTGWRSSGIGHAKASLERISLGLMTSELNFEDIPLVTVGKKHGRGGCGGRDPRDVSTPVRGTVGAGGGGEEREI